MTEDNEKKVLNINPPVPSPRPRPDRQGSGEFAVEGVSSSYHHRDYENATIVVGPADDAGGSSSVSQAANVAAGPGAEEPSNRPVPAPRRVKVQVFNEGEEGGAEGYRGTQYENVIIITPQASPIRAAPKIPSAPPYHALPASPSPMPPQVSFVRRRDNGNRAAAAAAAASADRRRHSAGPGSLLDGAAGHHREATECDKSGGDGDRKYKTSSPGDLFKSIGTTSRMLTESIGERVAHKSRKVAENVRNTSSTIVNWSQETGRSAAGKLKSVGRSSTRSNTSTGGGTTDCADEDEDEVDGGGGGMAAGATADSRRRSASKKRDEGVMMQNIKFSSPLLDESSTVITTHTVLPRNTTITTTTTSKDNDSEKDNRGRGAGRQLVESPSGQTYDIPRRANKPSNLRPAPPPASRPSSSGRGSGNTSPVSSASSSNATTTPDRWVGGTVCREVQRLPANFERISLARPNLYTTVVPKCQRLERGRAELSWFPPPPPEPLVDCHRHKSESNLHDSTFYVQQRIVLVDDGDGQLRDRHGSQNHLYGKLNILPRQAISSSSSSGGGGGGGSCRSSMADSEEDNMLPELRRLVELGSSIEVQAQTASGGGNSDAVTGSGSQIFSRQTSMTTIEDDDGQQAAAVAAAPVALVGQQVKYADEYLPLSWSHFAVADGATGSGVPPPVILAELKAVATNNGGEEQANRSAVTSAKVEPFYGNAGGAQPIYATLSEVQFLPPSLLQPVLVDRAVTPFAVNQGRLHVYDTVSSYSDIIDEFDPLAASTEANHSQSSLEAELFSPDSSQASSRGRDLSPIASMLGAESYAKPRRLTSPASQQQVVVGVVGVENEATGGGVAVSAHVDRGPQIPERSDSLLLPASTHPSPFRATVPVKPKRNKHPVNSKPPEEPTKENSVGGGGGGGNARSIGHIVHQNLSLPSDSMENLVDESLVQPYLSVVEEESVVVSGGSNGGSLDLSYPKRQPRTTNWYIDDVQSPDSALTDNTTASGGGVRDEATGSSRQHGGRAPEPESLPSYFEAIGGTDPLFERGLAAVTGPSQSEPQSKATVSGGSVASKLLNALKRRSSLNRGSSTAGTGPKADAVGRSTTTAAVMVPKPALTERLITHKGHVLKIPSGGKMGDMLHYELAPRSVVLRERILHTFLDPQQTLPKETIQLRYLLALQCVVQHKFMGEGGLHLHCFEIVLVLPKAASASGGGGLMAAAAAAVMSSGNPPDPLMPGGGGSHKTSRASYMFATHNRSDRNLWMAKVLQSVTDVFPEELLREFLRAGWCYVKKSVSACWAGAWVLLSKRRLYIFSYIDHQLDELDLRKARCIGTIEDGSGADDPLAELYVEAGPTMFIDCPPFPTLYLIMSSPRETQIWRKMVRQAAHQSGPTLQSQQLTRGDVPVLVDRCVNFIYAYGAMSEGIYRRSGSVSAVGRLLKLFANDAFEVQLTRAEFNEHDVAGALKKFIRELPGSFFGSFAASFTSIGMLNEVALKVESYQQLLQRLPRIEHRTLKKLIGHLAFVASLEQHNRMGIPNLAMIWGSTLMANSNQHTAADEASGGGGGGGGGGATGGYHQSDADVVADLIRLYPQLFPVSDDELRKDQLMLEVLQRYHAAAENLSDAVKHSGDLKVWITIDCDNSSTDEKQANNNTPNAEEKQQVNVDITPTKTASDVCKELASRTVYPWNKLTLYEIVLNGALVRPIHYGEKLLEIVVRWTYWDEADRKNNYLTLRPTTTLNDVYRTIQKSPVLEPTMELKFADPRTKALRLYQLQLMGPSLVVLKRIDKKDKAKGYEEMCTIDLTRVTAYIGCEPKRDKSSLRWAITLISKDFTKRTRDEPFVGHIFGGLDFASQILWYSSILYSHHKDDILPSGDLFFL